MKNWLIILSLLLSFNAYNQSLVIKEPAFGPNEKLSYIVSYKMKGLMTDLAGIDMEVLDVPGKKKPIYRLKFTVNTLTSWDSYVKIRHAYQTYIDPSTIKPLIMAQDSDVKGEITKAKYTFKYKTKTVNIKVSKSGVPDINKTIPIKTNTYDVVSLIYLSRSLDYDNYKIGQKIPISVAVMERLIDFNIKYMGKEMMKVEGMGTTQCYKVGIVLDRKFIVETDVTFIWLTADDNRVPVLIYTIFKEGRALIELSKYNGLKN